MEILPTRSATEPFGLRPPGSPEPAFATRANGSDFALQSVEARAEAINAQASTDPRAAVQQAAEEVQTIPEGPQRDHFVDALRPTFEAAGEFVAEDLLGGTLAAPEQSVWEGLTAIAEASGRGTEIAEAVAHGIGPERPGPRGAWGAVQNAALGDFVNQVREAHQGLVTETQAAQAAEAASGTAALAEVEAATAAVETAQGEVEALNAQLGSELALLGPGLSDADRAAYIQSFQTEHAATYESERAAAEALSAALANPDLEHAAAEDPEVGAAVTAGLERLSTSTAGGEALEILAQIAERPGSALAAQLSSPSLGNRLTEVAQAALPSAAGQLLAENDGDPGAAADALVNITRSALELVPDAGSGLSTFLGNLEKVANGDVRGAITGFGGELPGPLGQTFQAAGLVLAGAAAVGTADEAHFASTLASITRTGSKGVRLLSDVIDGIATGGSRFAQSYESTAAVTSRFADRFVPLLNIVSSAATAIAGLEELHEDPSAGRLITSLGNVASVVGSVLSATPAAPVGAIVGGIGGVVSAVGELVVAIEDHGELSQAAQERLEEIGVDRELAEQLAQHGGVTQALHSEVGLSAEQIQALYGEHGELIEHLGGLAFVAGQGNASDERFLELVDRLAAEADRQGVSVDDALTHLLSSDNLHIINTAAPDERARIITGLLNVDFPQSAGWFQQRAS